MADTVTDLREEMEALSIADYTKAVAASAPPLKPEATERLAALLRAPSPHGEAA